MKTPSALLAELKLKVTLFGEGLIRIKMVEFYFSRRPPSNLYGSGVKSGEKKKAALTKNMSAENRKLALKFLESENGAQVNFSSNQQLIEAVKTLSEGLRGLENFFQSVLPDIKAEDAPLKRKKRQRDPFAPKHPLTSYLLFARDHRQSVKENNPEFSPNQVATELGRLWREISKEEKDKYITEAEVLREQYNDDLKEYGKTKQQEQVVAEAEVEDSDSSSDEDEQLSQPVTKKSKVQTVTPLPEPEDSSSSSEEEELQIPTPAPAPVKEAPKKVKKKHLTESTKVNKAPAPVAPVEKTQSKKKKKKDSISSSQK